MTSYVSLVYLSVTTGIWSCFCGLWLVHLAARIPQHLKLLLRTNWPDLSPSFLTVHMVHGQQTCKTGLVCQNSTAWIITRRADLSPFRISFSLTFFLFDYAPHVLVMGLKSKSVGVTNLRGKNSVRNSQYRPRTWSVTCLSRAYYLLYIYSNTVIYNIRQYYTLWSCMDRQWESLLFGWRSILLINKSTKCHSAFILFNVIPSDLSPLCYQLGIKRFFFHSVNNQLLLSIGVQCVHEFQLKD